jgi:dihydroneopterin aldolase
MHRKETSVVFYEDYSKDIFTTLSTEEINLFYELLEVAAQQFLGSYAKEFSIKIKKLWILIFMKIYTKVSSKSNLILKTWN